MVIIVTGRVRITITGFTTVLISISTAATAIADIIPSTDTPGRRYEVIITDSPVTKILASRFMLIRTNKVRACLPKNQ